MYSEAGTTLLRWCNAISSANNTSFTLVKSPLIAIKFVKGLSGLPHWKKACNVKNAPSE
jgi:hypothetical protein